MATTAPPAKPQTFNGDLAHLPAILLPLTKLKRWVIWKWEYRHTKKGVGKWTKPPFQTRHTNRSARSNDPTTWGTYEEALAAFNAGLCEGIGIMLLGADLGAVDLDHIRDLLTGKVLYVWAEQDIVTALRRGAYVEWTVSGTGARIIGAAHGSEIHRKITYNRGTGAGVEVYRNCARYITISGLQLKDYAPEFDILHAPLTPAELVDLPPCDDLFVDLSSKEADEEGGEDGEPKQQTKLLDFNSAGPQPIDYQAIIENGVPEGERSEKFQQVIWHLANQGWTAEQITEELGKYANGIGAKYANRLQLEVQRSFNKWRTKKRTTAAGGAVPVNAPWPQIRIVPGEIPRIVNEAEEALILLGREIYQRSGMLVRPVLIDLKAADDRDVKCWRLVPVTQAYLVDAFTCAARFLRHDGRSKNWNPVDAPSKIAEIYLAREGAWKLPVLAGIINAPILRTDGSICELPGYDAKSRLLFKSEEQIFPPVPQLPDKAEAKASLERLRRLVVTFPFMGDADRSVSLAGILTALDRRSLATAPLIAYTAPTSGTGKSLLVDLTSILATGRPMPVLSQGKNEDEFEKRLGASLLASDVCISIDNCEAPLSGALLCQALTQGELNIRMLGYSRNINTSMNAAIFATGNNLIIAGDLTRRCLLASLDAGVERPELRRFSTDVLEEASVHRGELVVAGLTILRAWHVAYAAGERVTAAPFGGFDEWSHRVREPLIWLGEADPCDTVTKVRSNDPARDDLATVLLQWKENLRIGSVHTVQDIIGRAVNVPTFYTALLNVACSKTGSTVSNERLGRWLKRVEGKIINGLKLIQDGNNHGYPLWTLKQ